MNMEVQISLSFDTLPVTQSCRSAFEGNKIYFIELKGQYPKNHVYLTIPLLSLPHSMFTSRIILAFLSLLLVGSVAAARIIPNRGGLELVARAPNKHFEKAKSVMRSMGKKFKPKSGESAFWSGTRKYPGHKNAVSVKKEANDIAKSAGQKTINHALADAHIKIPGRDNPYHVRLWNFASKLWAKKAHGETHAYLGKNVNEEGVYTAIERPALLKSKKVTKLMEHNLHTGESKNVKG